jgi:GxxExxY protein
VGERVHETTKLTLKTPSLCFSRFLRPPLNKYCDRASFHATQNLRRIIGVSRIVQEIRAAFGLHSGSAMRIDPEPYNHITGKIVAAAIEVHRALGPGLLESIYVPCLHYELAARSLRFVSQRSIPIIYKGMSIAGGYRIDLIVEGVVVVEIKSIAAILPVHECQLQTYLRVTGCPIGQLINFNVPVLKDGVKRRLNPWATLNGTEATEVTD